MGANISNNHDDIEGLDESSSEAWGDYPLDTVFVRKENRTVGDVVHRIRKGRYKLDPEFQRDFVWDSERQARLIESCLMRIPLPVLYVAEDLDGRIIVVDGLQRLTTFYHYLNDVFALTHIGTHDPESLITNRKFSELPIHLQERIEDTQLTLYILDPKAPERARLDIFERVNSGVPLTRQQMRNCLYSGPATRWLKTASEDSSFMQATVFSSNAKKAMRDRQVINRFCAFYLLDWYDYNGDMEGYLGKVLAYMNTMSEENLDSMMNAFRSSMHLNFKLFGRHAFRKSLLAAKPEGAKSVFNISLFDALSTVMAKHEKKLETTESGEIISCVKEVLEDPSFMEAITLSTNNTEQVQCRHACCNTIFDIMVS
ncbi:MAG: DUF262 domain-containing protein [Mariprofundaceae bacterium]|nr:DUF262 domain-containing protein [Mariprofundaceae bacterium]